MSVMLIFQSLSKSEGKFDHVLPPYCVVMNSRTHMGIVFCAMVREEPLNLVENSRRLVGGEKVS